MSDIVAWDNNQQIDYGNYGNDKTVVRLDKVPVLHLCQNNSPEINSETATPGETVMRLGEKGDPSNPNLGKTWQGIVVARGTQYVWWGDREEGGGMPLARCIKGNPVPEGCSPKDLLWQDQGGTPREDGKKGPVADETQTFLVCAYKDGEIGPPALLTYARGGKKTGDGVQMLLNAFNGPCYAAVLEFYTEKTANAEGQPFYILKARGKGQLPADSPLLPKLKELHDANQPHLTPKPANA